MNCNVNENASLASLTYSHNSSNILANTQCLTKLDCAGHDIILGSFGKEKNLSVFVSQ